MRSTTPEQDERENLRMSVARQNFFEICKILKRILKIFKFFKINFKNFKLPKLFKNFQIPKNGNSPDFPTWGRTARSRFGVTWRGS
jgi:hypothetical protein